MEKYGFIYIWYDRKRKMYYIGRHWGTEDDGYICSSKWMRDAYRYRKQDFVRRIIQKTNQREELPELERKWLSLIKEEELGQKYYNLHKECNLFEHWSDDEYKKMTVAQRISKSSFGKKSSVETKQKISKANKGRKLSEETKRKMSLYRKGRKRSPEVIDKIVGNLKLMYEKKEECPVCKKRMYKNLFIRYGHGMECEG